MSELESVLEEKLIEQLTQGRSQWTYRPDIKNEKQLWANFRDKLENNNKAVLGENPLTDGEFEQIKEFMLDHTSTPYDAALWLAGENGIAEIKLVREDAALGTVHLLAINNREIAGGHSSYEVINQYCVDKASESDRARRFDVTLIINGMPMIQIELKSRQNPYMDAFRQIQKYSEEGKYRALFGTLQMFVVSNGTDTRYIAADTYDRLNDKFLSTWVDKNNKRVGDYLAFADQVLHIPEAHQLIGNYSVLDNARKKLILLRPYQIHAIESVKAASREQKSGFVWHTTGSGKTLTSYTVTKNLLNIPAIDKAIFLIDRKDLDDQTTMEFQAYAENDTIDVDETQNTKSLINKLKEKSRKAIVTTIQKLQIVMKRYSSEQKKDGATAKRLRSLKLCFVVDECHRSVSPKTKKQIEYFFTSSMWYGFTGTPIFEEVKRAREGNLARTTHEEYGDCLHAYTVKEALHDSAVLGFQIEYMKAVLDNELIRTGVKLGADEIKLRELKRADLEETVGNLYKKATKKDLYDDEEHKKQVVDFICNRVAGKMRLNAPEGKAYEGLLTVQSITDAQEYYSLFKEFKANNGVSESIKKLLPDYPKFAITYTVGENEEGARVNQKLMQQSLDDYNAMFGTKFTMEDGMRAYNKDLNDRLARKKAKYSHRDQQLDLVIVVDRLLTGFDAPCMSTLFIDRPPMSAPNMIQAFSRTNRLYDKTKRFGQIIVCRTPGMYEREIDKAFLLYSQGGGNEVSAPKYSEMLAKFKQALQELKAFAPTPDVIADMYGDEAAMRKFAKLFQAFDRAYGEVKVYLEWKQENLEADFGISEKNIEVYTGQYKNVIEELKKLKRKEDGIEIDVDYELESVKTTEINYRYLISLIQSYVPDADELGLDEIKDDKVDGYIKTLQESNPKLADLVSAVWNELKANPANFKGKQIMQLINEKINATIGAFIDDFCDKWCVGKDDLLFQAMKYQQGNQISLTFDYAAYKEKNPDGLSKLKYQKEARRLAEEVIVNEVLPLLEK